MPQPTSNHTNPDIRRLFSEVTTEASDLVTQQYQRLFVGREISGVLADGLVLGISEYIAYEKTDELRLNRGKERLFTKPGFYTRFDPYEPSRAFNITVSSLDASQLPADIPAEWWISPIRGYFTDPSTLEDVPRSRPDYDSQLTNLVTRLHKLLRKADRFSLNYVLGEPDNNKPTTGLVYLSHLVIIDRTGTTTDNLITAITQTEGQQKDKFVLLPLKGVYDHYRNSEGVDKKQRPSVKSLKNLLAAIKSFKEA